MFAGFWIGRTQARGQHVVRDLLLLVSVGVLGSLAGFALTEDRARAATTLTVPGEYATIQAAITASNNGDIIQISPGTYVGNFIINKSVTIRGVDRDTVIIDGDSTAPGTSTFSIEADNVAIADLSIKYGVEGIRFSKTSTPIVNTTINNVTVSDNSSYGVTVHNLVTVDRVTVSNSTFARNLTGFRLATEGIGKDITIQNSIFTSNQKGFIQETTQKTGYVDGLIISDSIFENHSESKSVPQEYGIYGEEFHNVQITDNIFRNNWRAFSYSNSNNLADRIDGGITFARNTLIDHGAAAVTVKSRDALEEDVVFSENVITQDVAKTNWGQIFDLQLGSGVKHASVKVQKNEVTLTGTQPSKNKAHYAVLLVGDYDGIEISNNTFNGDGNSGDQGVTGVAAVPGSGNVPGSGIFTLTVPRVGSSFEPYGGPSASSQLLVQNNTITGFVNGISFYDDQNHKYGGLPASAGAGVVLRGNSLAGNSEYAIRSVLTENGTPIDARSNWWGSANGPGIVEPVNGIVNGRILESSVVFSPWISAFVASRTPQVGFTPTSTTLTTSLPAGMNVQQEFRSATSEATAALTFNNVTSPGAVTVVEYNSVDALPEQPSGFSLGDPPTYFDIDTTAVFSGPVEVCLTYPTGAFPAGTTPKLYHFTSGQWKDITTSLDESTRTLCGSVTSFSPFAIGKVDAPVVAPVLTPAPTVGSTPTVVSTTRDVVQTTLPLNLKLLTTVRLLARGTRNVVLNSTTPSTCAVVGERLLALREGSCVVQTRALRRNSSPPSVGRVLSTLRTTITTTGTQVGLTLTKRGEVNFKRYSSNPNNISSVLVNAARNARGVVLVGHTAIFTGNSAGNTKLSLARANVVRQYLIKQKVNRGRISVLGLAARQPVSETRAETAQRVNRRVEMYTLS